MYAGEDSARLDAPLQRRLDALGSKTIIVSEGEASEWYLDTLAVSSQRRAQGIGTQFLRWLQGQAGARNLPLGLLVEEGNPARQLYERLGFEASGEQLLGTHRYERLR